MVRRSIPQRERPTQLLGHPPGNGVAHVALLVQKTALARGRPKQVHHRCHKSVMAIGHDEFQLGRSARAQVLEHTPPAVFALLGTGMPRHHLFVARQVHSQGCQDHSRIGLVAMPHLEMDAIQVEDAPVLVQPTLAPSGELLL